MAKDFQDHLLFLDLYFFCFTVKIEIIQEFFSLPWWQESAQVYILTVNVKQSFSSVISTLIQLMLIQ